MSDYDTVLEGLCRCGHAECKKRIDAANRIGWELDALRARVAELEAIIFDVSTSDIIDEYSNKVIVDINRDTYNRMRNVARPEVSRG